MLLQHFLSFFAFKKTSLLWTEWIIQKSSVRLTICGIMAFIAIGAFFKFRVVVTNSFSKKDTIVWVSVVTFCRQQVWFNEIVRLIKTASYCLLVRHCNVREQVDYT